jgi:cupin fold WbuC family metalloprotein
MVQQLNRDLIDRVTEAARQSLRKRMNYNFHAGPGDNPHRFLNVLLKGTYVRPHRHWKPPKTEAFLALEGCGAVICFDGSGTVSERYLIGQGADAPGSLACAPRSIGIDIPAGVWHSVVALSEVLVCYEVKPGPWDPISDKEFADWAPEEGSLRVEEYLSELCR